jgi:hypothetical protein
MAEPDAEKADLLRYLQVARDALLWKLDGLSEYDIRRPMTPTGTNLLGLVKHSIGTELGYLGDTFGRPPAAPLPWEAEVEQGADMWATADESRAYLVGLYREAWAHADATVAALSLAATGRVPWWPPEVNEVTLHRVLVHMTAETHRHAGHADIIRETIDGATGLREDGDNMPPDASAAHWESYRGQIERAARAAAGR